MSAIDFVSNILYLEMEIKTETEIKMIWKLKTETKTEMFSKYNRNLKEPITHKTIIETELSFETEISLIIRQTVGQLFRLCSLQCNI